MFQHLILSSSTENERNYTNMFWIWCFPIRPDKNLLQLKKALEIKYYTQRDLHPLSVNCWESHIFLPVLETKSAPLLLIQTSLKGSLVLKQIYNILLCNNSSSRECNSKSFSQFTDKLILVMLDSNSIFSSKNSLTVNWD